MTTPIPLGPPLMEWIDVTPSIVEGDWDNSGGAFAWDGTVITPDNSSDIMSIEVPSLVGSLVGMIIEIDAALDGDDCDVILGIIDESNNCVKGLELNVISGDFSPVIWCDGFSQYASNLQYADPPDTTYPVNPPPAAPTLRGEWLKHGVLKVDGVVAVMVGTGTYYIGSSNVPIPSQLRFYNSLGSAGGVTFDLATLRVRVATLPT